MAEKRRIMSRAEKIMLILALLIVVYFLFARSGIKIGKVTEETEIVDPYRGQ